MNAVLSLLVLTAIVLLTGAIFLWRRGGSRRQVILMLVLVAVIAANIAILAIPTGDGAALVADMPK